MEEKAFRRLSVPERVRLVCERGQLTREEADILSGKPLSTDIAENLIENALGYFQVPLGIATHFRIDGQDLLIPMAVEETSIIAAASAAAKWLRTQGEVTTATTENLVIGQIQLPRVGDPERVAAQLRRATPDLIEAANRRVPTLVARGGGVREIEARRLARADNQGTMVVIHVHCDPCDAMGANLVNQICEALKPLVEQITGESVGLCILSNLVDRKLVRAKAVIPSIEPALGEAIAEAAIFAETDPYRATTHNKGVMNGVDAVLLATGNDWRAVEAGVHAYAAREGRYRPITSWKMEGPALVGRLEAPIALGTVGGVTRVHPMTRMALKILGVTRASELARICAAVGLVQNLAALRALATVGIVRGHMELHASNLALAAGSARDEIPLVRERLAEMLAARKTIGLSDAEAILQDIRREVRDARNRVLSGAS